MSIPVPKHLTLYTYHRSSASGRVRTVMALHNIERDDKFIHLVKNEQKSDEYLKVNPSGLVPALIVTEQDGSQWALSQCVAIMEYLDEVYGDKSPVGPLLPRNDAKARALVRSIVDLVVGDIFPMLNMGTLSKVKDLGATAPDWAKLCATPTLKALEGLLKTTSTSGKYCYGDSVTMADCALLPQLYTVLRFCPDILPQFPTITSIFENISKLPEFVKADFRHQPDTPDELKA